jgi:hypothetical protein
LGLVCIVPIWRVFEGVSTRFFADFGRFSYDFYRLLQFSADFVEPDAAVRKIGGGGSLARFKAIPY